jgi:hypothetical protein
MRTRARPLFGLENRKANTGRVSFWLVQAARREGSSLRSGEREKHAALTARTARRLAPLGRAFLHFMHRSAVPAEQSPTFKRTGVLSKRSLHILVSNLFNNFGKSSFSLEAKPNAMKTIQFVRTVGPQSP